MSKLAIVAGVGPGMGVAIARRFAREGFTVAMIARDKAKLEQYERDIGPSDGATLSVAADLCDLDSVRAAFSHIVNQHGPADVLVYNGARWHEIPAMQIDPMVFNWDIALSVTGALACAQHVYPGMKDRRSGTILFTGGGLALYPAYGAGVASLTAGKSALRGLTYALAKELAADDIHVATVTIAGTVAPDTPFAPDRIADHYWRLHMQPKPDWQVEQVFDGA